MAIYEANMNTCDEFIKDEGNIDLIPIESGEQFRVSYQLSGCESSNVSQIALFGESYSTTLTAKLGYRLKSSDITVFVNSIDVTSSAVSGMNVYVDYVDAPIIIRAKAKQITGDTPIIVSSMFIVEDEDNPTTISDTATLHFSAVDGYNLPGAIKVLGCEYTWDRDTGTLELSNVEDDLVDIDINGITATSVADFVIASGKYTKYIGSNNAYVEVPGTIGMYTSIDNLPGQELDNEWWNEFLFQLEWLEFEQIVLKDKISDVTYTFTQHNKMEIADLFPTADNCLFYSMEVRNVWDFMIMVDCFTYPAVVNGQVFNDRFELQDWLMEQMETHEFVSGGEVEIAHYYDGYDYVIEDVEDSEFVQDDSVIETLKFGDGIRNVMIWALGQSDDVTNLQTIVLGKDVENFYFDTGEQGMASLQAFEVDDENTSYYAVDGVLFQQPSYPILVKYPSGKDGPYAIPAGTKTIQGATSTNQGMIGGAFRSCVGDLTSLTFPTGITNINSYAFHFCLNLGVIDTKDVTLIGANAFSYSGITELITSATIIQGEAFGQCNSLTKVTLNGAITNLYSSFGGCSSLQEVTLTNTPTLASIGNNAFSYCTSLTTFNWTNCANNCVVDSYAFNNCTSLANFNIPEGVTRIGTSCFSHTALTEIDLPDSLITIDGDAFNSCTNLINMIIPNNVTNIGYTICQNCTNLTSITIGTSVTSIGQSAFNRCINVTEINYNAPNAQLAANYNYPFTDCGINTSGITFNVGSSVYAIPTYIFNSYGSYAAPKIVNFIWPQAASGHTVTLPNIGTMLYQSYFNELILPEGLITLDQYINYGGIKKITLPSTLTNLPDYMISQARDLTEINYNCANPTTVGQNLFEYCGENSSQLVLNIGPLVSRIPNNLFVGTNITEMNWDECPANTTIGTSAFTSCNRLTKVDVPNNVVSIGANAFYDCAALTEINYNAINIPDASSDDYQLFTIFNNESTTPPASPRRTLNIGASVQYIPRYVFTDNTQYRGMYNVYYYSCIQTINWLNCPSNATMSIFAFGTISTLTTAILPNNLTTIPERAFSGCANLTAITIPSNVTSIGNQAFNSCMRLTSLTIPNNVSSIGTYTFYRCTGLTTITISDSVTSIGDFAFYQCYGLTSVTIPSNVSSMGTQAFSSCTGLTSVTILNGVTNIGNFVFSNCSGITSITIPDSVTSIGNGAFAGCSSLTNVVIPNNVTSIGDLAFQSCTSLTSVTIPAGVTNIGENAFYSCSNLATVNFLQTTIQNLTLYNESFIDISSAVQYYFVDTQSNVEAWTYYNTNCLDNPNYHHYQS